MIYFDALTESDCEQIRKWRNEDISAARTPFLITELMQKRDFYENIVSNRNSPHVFWAVKKKDTVENGVITEFDKPAMIGIAGLTYIEDKNGRAEIALMIGREYRGNGYGIEAFGEIKKWAFERMGLHTIYACVYGNNPDIVDWWRHRKPTEECSYPGGKFWDGKRWRTYHFTWVNE